MGSQAGVLVVYSPDGIWIASLIKGPDSKIAIRDWCRAERTAFDPIAAVPAAPIAARNLPFIWLLEEKAGAVRRLAGFRCESGHLSSVQTPRLQSLARLDSVHNVA